MNQINNQSLSLKRIDDKPRKNYDTRNIKLTKQWFN